MLQFTSFRSSLLMSSLFSVHEFEYTVGQYLFDRLHELGVRHLFAIPGAHSSHWLHNYVEVSSSIQRFGTTNALNAGYAADGYARMNGIGAVCVPYSVGALSLLGAVAGAHAERVPVVVINGAPGSPSALPAHRNGHSGRSAVDSLPSNGDAHSIYERVTCASERIDDSEQAPRQIDRALRACLRHSRPVYLEPREDVYDQPCPPVESTLTPPAASGEPALPSETTDSIVSPLQQADSILLWGGIELQRYGLEDTFEALVRTSDTPYVTSLLSKGLLPEQHDHFAGILDVHATAPAVRALVERVDHVLGLGVDPQSERLPDCVADTDSVTLVHNGTGAPVQEAAAQRLSLDSTAAFRTLLSTLVETSISTSVDGAEQAAQTRRAAPSPGSAPSPDPDATMTFQGFFNLISDYVDDDTILMSGIGLDRFGSQTLPVRTGSGFVCQGAYCDKGYVTPAAIGVDLGSSADRVFVFVGDGGFQSSPQCVGTMAEKGIDPVIFVLNNGVYGGEQWRTDPAPFEDGDSFFPHTILQHWHYQKLPDALGGRGWRVDTYGELRTAVEEAERYVGGPLVIDVRLKQKSLPALLD